MLERLTEQQDIWDYLALSEKPILLYGMGDGALKIMKEMKKHGIPVSGIFASDEFVRGHSFEGHQVMKFSEARERYEDFIILLAFAVFREPLLSKIYEMSESYEMYAPDVPVYPEDETVFGIEYIREHEQELEQVYACLEDELSRKVFLNTLNFKISGKISYLREITTPMEEVYETVLHLDESEDYLDLGAYNGDTISEFLEHTNGKYHSITAFEPDKKNFKKLLKLIEEKNLQNVDARNVGSYDKPGELLFAGKAGRNSTLTEKQGIPTPVDSVDHVFQGRRVSVIKLDVEGAEEKTLEGCRETISLWRPKLLLSAYHKNSDLFRLPLLILSICQEYHLFFRHHPYVPAWETNFYFVPKKRG